MISSTCCTFPIAIGIPKQVGEFLGWTQASFGGKNASPPYGAAAWAAYKEVGYLGPSRAEIAVALFADLADPQIQEP